MSVSFEALEPGDELPTMTVELEPSFVAAYAREIGMDAPRFTSPELDQVILAARREQNRDKRRELYCKFGQIYRDQALGLPLYASFRTTTARSHVRALPLVGDFRGGICETILI